jgi:hypothetical protein
VPADQLAMTVFRPKWWWRLAVSIVLVAAWWEFVRLPMTGPVVVVMLVQFNRAMERDKLQLMEGTLYRRRSHGWGAPIVLGELQQVECQGRTLRVTDRAGATTVLRLRRWTNWRTLAGAVADLAGPSALDDETRARLFVLARRPAMDAAAAS